MSNKLGATMVSEVAQTNLVTVQPTTKLEQIAKLFEQHDINAAPVVDGVGKCLGIITSRDLVRYESMRSQLESEFRHGLAFDLAHYADGSPSKILGQPFDEAAYHMSKDIKTISGTEPISRAGRIMCQEHIHHLIILDSADRPIGILSTLDVLAEALDEVVASKSLVDTR